MNNSHIKQINRINYINTEIESLYHKASLKLGISDSVSIVLYTLYDEGDECLLGDIYKKSGISKQTVNSAIRSLEKDGILYLEQYTGRAKRVILTDKGKDFVKKTAARLHKAEIQAFDSWTEEEIGMYIALNEKYMTCFRQQVEKL